LCPFNGAGRVAGAANNGVYPSLQGRHDEALEEMRRALERSCDAKITLLTSFVAIDPLWDPLRDKPRFKAILRRIGLPGSTI
jgi:hypothetical protein